MVERRGGRKYRVKRTVFFAAFLNEIKIFAPLVGNPSDAEIRQQTKFKHSFACHKRLEGDGGAAEEMLIFSDDGFDLVAVGGEEAAVLTGTCRSAGGFRPQVGGEPDAIVHGVGVGDDQGGLFW